MSVPSLAFFTRCRSCALPKVSDAREFSASELRKTNKQCKGCTRAANRNRYARNRQQRLEYQREYRKNNPEAVSASMRAWSEKNRDYKLAYNQRYYAANQQRLLEDKRRYYAENAECILERHREYYRQNKPLYFASRDKRRLLIKQDDSTYTAKDLEDMYASQNGLCCYCEIDISGGYEADHLLPLSRGGSNGVENLALACKPCNRRKHAKTAEEFMAVLAAEWR